MKFYCFIAMVFFLGTTGSPGFAQNSQPASTLNHQTDLKHLLLEQRKAAEFQLMKNRSHQLLAPSNDLCSGAELIPATGPFPYYTSITSDISSATTTNDPPVPSCQNWISRSIWYTFTPSVTATYTIASCAGLTGTTVDDNVMALYTSTGTCNGPFIPLPDACSDDDCSSGSFLAKITRMLLKDTTYYIVVWQYGTYPPQNGHTAVQLNVTQYLPPTNDNCSAATTLSLNIPKHGTTAFGENDFQLSGQICFTGNGAMQNVSPASGRDVVYSFIPPSTGTYSIRVTNFSALTNLVFYAATTCPSGTAPVTVTSCLGASNRVQSNSSEEIYCLPLVSGQQIFLFVDEHEMSVYGSEFIIEVNVCAKETESNNIPATATAFTIGVEGSIFSNGDVDFFALGTPPENSRVFALVDGVAAYNPDFDLRVTTSTNVLEYDDNDNDSPFGAASANIEGRPLSGDPTYLRVTQFSSGATSEPYRLYAVVQPQLGNAISESEPNNTSAIANHAAANYFYGSLSSPAPSQDVDYYGFMANEGDLLFLGLDGDPLRDNSPINAAMALLDDAGKTLVSVNDAKAASSTTTMLNDLAASTPHSPGEGIVYRVPETGIFYVKISIGTSLNTAIGAGDYLLSFSKNGTTSGGGLPADVAVSMIAPGFAATGFQMEYQFRVTNNGPVKATNVLLSETIPIGTTFQSIVTTHGTCTTPAVGGIGAISCTIGTLQPHETVNFTLILNVTASSGATITNTISASADQPDIFTANNMKTLSTSVISSVAELGVSVTNVPDSAVASGLITYGIRVRHSGNASAANAMLLDTIPAYCTFVSIKGPSGWSFITPAVGTAGIVTATHTLFPASSVADFVLTVKVDANTPHAKRLLNCAFVSSDIPDPILSNNQTCGETIAISHSPRISLVTNNIAFPFGCRAAKYPQTQTKSIVVTNYFGQYNVAEMRWNASTTSPEITLLTSSGGENDTLRFQVNTKGLPPGSYARTIPITAYNSETNLPADNSPFDLTITIEIEPVVASVAQQTLPVGVGSWTTFRNLQGQPIAQMKSNTTTLSNVTVTLHPCETGNGLGRMRYVNRYYEFSTTEPTPNVDIRMFYTENDLTMMMITEPSLLRGWRQTPMGGVWFSTTSTSDPLHNIVEVKSAATLDGLWTMAIAYKDGGIPIPGLMVSWAGPMKAKLDWMTDVEVGGTGILIERSLHNNNEWQLVGRIPTKSDGQYESYDTANDALSYDYRLLIVDTEGTVWQSETKTLKAQNVTATDANQAPTGFALGQNSPNPLVLTQGTSTSISYTIPKDSHVRLVVYDSYGREVQTLVDHQKSSGVHNVRFHAETLPAGTYFYRLQADGNVAVKKIVVIQ